MRTQCEFRGTTTYASPHAHRGDDLCPRDDLYSLMFVFFDLICGKLPWSEASRAKIKDKAAISLSKDEYTNEPQKLVSWVNQTAQERIQSHVRRSLVSILVMFLC